MLSRTTTGNWCQAEWNIFVPLFFCNFLVTSAFVLTRIKLTGVDCSWQCPIHHWQTNGKTPVTSVIILQKVQKYSGSLFSGNAKNTYALKASYKTLKYPTKKILQKRMCNVPLRKWLCDKQHLCNRGIVAANLTFFFFFHDLTPRERVWARFFRRALCSTVTTQAQWKKGAILVQCNDV